LDKTGGKGTRKEGSREVFLRGGEHTTPAIKGTIIPIIYVSRRGGGKRKIRGVRSENTTMARKREPFLF